MFWSLNWLDHGDSPNGPVLYDNIATNHQDGKWMKLYWQALWYEIAKNGVGDHLNNGEHEICVQHYMFEYLELLWRQDIGIATSSSSNIKVMRNPHRCTILFFTVLYCTVLHCTASLIITGDTTVQIFQRSWNPNPIYDTHHINWYYCFVQDLFGCLFYLSVCRCCTYCMCWNIMLFP